MTHSPNDATAVRVNIPTALRPFTDDQRAVELSGETVGTVLQNLAEQFPALKQHLFDEEGGIRSFVSVYLGDEDIRHLEREATPISGSAELSIVPSIAGGASGW